MELNKLKPNPKNPRLIKDDKFHKLVKSLQEFPEMLEKRPIVCVTDTDGKLYPLGGNMRLKALQELKYKEIPDKWITLADEWSEGKRNEFTIKDNVGFGEWDFDILIDEWDTDKLEEWGIYIEDNEAENSKEKIKTIELKGFQKTHILLSFSPELFIEIQDYIQKIKDTEGIEYEQSSN